MFLCSIAGAAALTGASSRLGEMRFLYCHVGFVVSFFGHVSVCFALILFVWGGVSLLVGFTV